MFEIMLGNKKANNVTGTGFGLFAGGGASLNQINKYDYSSDVTTVVNALLQTGRSFTAGTGNINKGIFAGGWYQSNVVSLSDLYTYSENTIAPGSTLKMARRAAAAASCSAFCLIGAGVGVTAYTETYNYSTNSGVAGSVLGLARYSLAATGTETFALFGGGTTSGSSNRTYTDKYIYSTNVCAPSTALGYARQGLAASGNTTQGIFGGGAGEAGVNNGVYTDIFNYANNTVIPSSKLLSARSFIAATGNANVALFGGGNSFTDKYFYSSASVKAGTNMAAIASNMSACSSSPGGL